MSNIKYKNYIDHETNVKFVDGILEQRQEWQWFINYVEHNYVLSDIKNYSDFQNISIPMIHILERFLKILEVSDTELIFDSSVLCDVFITAKYYIGALTRERCYEKITTEFGKILFIFVWLTKLQNSGNSSKYIVDTRFINQRNYHQSINMEAFDYDKEAILLLLDELNVREFDKVKKTIIDNLNKVYFDLSDSFFEKYGENLFTANCFDYQSLDRDLNLTWQEHALLDMIQISIRDGKVIPMFSGNGRLVPDYSIWTSRYLEKIKKYFDNEIANYVIESIDFLLNGNTPSLKTIENHCRFFIELVENSDANIMRSSSSYEILTLLFKDDIMNKVEKTELIKRFYKNIHKITSIDQLLIIRDSFPINQTQRNTIKKYTENQFKAISSIEDLGSFTQYLENYDISKYITQKYYDKTKDKFLQLTEGVKDLSVSALFYKAMLFIIDVNQTNQNVDKRIIKQDMIRLQDHWQRNIYQQQVENLQEFEYNTEIPTTTVEECNEIVVNNPVIFAKSCIITKKDDMITFLAEVSDFVFSYMDSKITLSPIFPIKVSRINFEKNEIDYILKSQIEELLENYSYKFLNMLDAKVYVSALHERCISNAKIYLSMFNDLEEIYGLLGNYLEVSLIPYEKDISLGHLTQLFPLLEIEIRRLGKMFGIVPFKENKDEFMKFKDPSSILRELIDTVYQEFDGLENVPDLLFVYHFMYNGSSLNVRNECIHGRDYIHGSALVFGFKITLLSLYMIRYRIDIILSNLSHSNEN